MPTAESKAEKWTKHDLYAFNPTYEWTSYKTQFGAIMSYMTVLFLLSYIFITSRDYVVRPPELVSQGDIDLLQTAEIYRFDIPKIGLRISYTNESDPTNHITALDNKNPYIRFHFRHVIVQDQMRVSDTELQMEDCIVSNIPSLCPLTNETYKLQGTFYNEEYRFIEITVDKCTGENVCASSDEINEKINSGQFRIRAQVSLEAEQFDVEKFHTTGIGSTVSNRSLEYFGLPDIEVQSDIILKARVVSKEQRYAGSPPLPETETNILSFDRRDTSYRPLSARQNRVLSFAIRLDDNVNLQELTYWCPSILDLFGLWGAILSFVSSLSIGFLASVYNKWSFERHFRHAADKKRREAQLMTVSAMEWMRKKGSERTTRNRETIYRSLQTQHDALMVEPDLRLFESHHFDVEGRVDMTAPELKYPTTAFGELRRLAILEHGKKKRAAEFLSLWYGRRLVKKGFIKDPQRRKELFSVPHMVLANYENEEISKKPFSWIFPNRSRSRLRRRKPSPVTQEKTEWENEDVELGGVTASGAKTNESSEESKTDCKATPSYCEDVGRMKNVGSEQEKAQDVIAALDPMSRQRG